MRSRSLLVTLSALTLSSFAQARGDDAVLPVERFDGQKVVRITPRNAGDILLMDQISGDRWTCGRGGPNGEADYRVNAADLKLLDQAGIKYQIKIEDVQKLIDAEKADLNNPFQDRAFFDTYQNYASVNTYIDSLVSTYPGYVTKVSLGSSIQGRDIPGFRVTSPVAPIGGSPRKPVVIFNSEQHAREWISVMVDLYIATQLLSTYPTDPIAKDLLDTYEFVFVPMCNPDGYNITWTSSRLWRKNARTISGTVRGVDLNRNWSVGWGLNSGSSGSSTSDTYRGTVPFSEPESQALRNYALAVPKLVANIDFHSYSQLVLRPYLYQYTLPPGKASIDRIGNAMVSAIAAKTGAPYEYGGPDILYLASGTSSDWFFGTTGALALGIELRDTGANGFVLPASQIIPTGQDAYAAAVTMITHLCRADLNRDNFIDDADFVLFAGSYDTLLTNSGDFTGDGMTDDFDFVIFAEGYDQLTCP